MDRLCDFLSSVPIEVFSKQEAQDLAESLRSQVRTNSSSRLAVHDLLNAFADVSRHSECTAAAMTSEYLKMSKVGSTQQTLLSQAVALRKLVAKEIKPFLFSQCSTALTLEITFEGPAQRIVVSPEGVNALPGQLMKLPIIELASGMLTESVDTLMGEFARVNAIAAVQTPGKYDPNNLAASLDSLVAPSMQTKALKSAKGFLAEAVADHDLKWDGDDTKLVLDTILSTISGGSTKASVAKLCRDSVADSEVKEASTDAIMYLLTLMSCMVKASCLFAWCRANIATAKTYTFIQNMQFCPRLEFAIIVLGECVSSVRGAIADYGEKYADQLEGLPFTCNIHEASAWLDVASSTALLLQRTIITGCIAHCEKISSDLVGATPSYDHLIGDKDCNIKAAKDYLLKWPSMARLNAGVKETAHALSEVSRVHAVFKMEPFPITTDEEFRVPLGSVEKVFINAKTAVAVIVGVRCLTELTGEAQRARAKMLLEKQGANAMPKALVAKLKAFV